MDKFIINGGSPLAGEVTISGAKNAVLPIMAACIIKPGRYIINNVPNLKDTRTMISLIEESGANIEFSNNVLKVDSTTCNNPVAPYRLVKTMRASFYMLGPFMSRFNKAIVSLPGGCAWGPRPVNFHIEALEKMGAKIELKDGNIVCKGKLKGTLIEFEKKSVGATGNIIMAAVEAEGSTEIVNAACEPEIADLCNFIELMGVNIDGIGTDKLVIHPNSQTFDSPHVDKDVEIEYTVIPDRIEAGTFMIATLMTKGDIILKNVNVNHLDAVIQKIKEAGGKINKISDSSMNVKYVKEIIPTDIETLEYPGYPTDLQAQWMALMSISSGESRIVENIYKDRFTHISELTRFGADICLENNQAFINGIKSLTPAPVMSTDIRASASLILAALSANGKSSISRIYHIDRGYEQIEKKIKSLGGDIARVSG